MQVITVAKFTDLKEAKNLFRKYSRTYKNTDITVALLAYDTIIGLSISKDLLQDDSKVLLIEHVPCLDCTIKQSDFINKLEIITNLLKTTWHSG